MKKLDSHAAQIEALRSELGNRVTLFGHHYQQQNVIDHCDFKGDSLELARRVSGIESEHIVFCGVYFMGESAALLAKPDQQVHLPESNADCVMSLMTPAMRLDRVLTHLQSSGKKLIPLAYVNTSVDVKGVVGRHGGAVCTSANAEIMLRWALAQGDGVVFLPDKNLGQNTAHTIGIPAHDMHILDIRKQGEAADPDAAQKATLLLWPGLCAIHARFNVNQITEARAADPHCLVVVHPECTPEVVQASDAAGSTSFIIKYVASAPEGSHIFIGTEINLVRRLEREYAGRLRIEPLRSSACSHMAKVTPAKVLQTLERIKKGTGTPVRVAPETAEPARAALERMLAACAAS